MFPQMNRTVVILLALVLTFSAAAVTPWQGIGSSRVFASNKQEREFRPKIRVSDDLREKVRRDKRSLVPALIQLTVTPETATFHELVGEIKRAGGIVTRKYRHMSTVAVLLPPDAIGLLSTNPNVDYISIDRPTQMTGHLERTTGAGP